jgi:predicted NodU family carbamoyl transferase
MKILGIHIGHDSSAALVGEGQIVAVWPDEDGWMERPQTVKEGFNRRFWNLIEQFGKPTGEHLLLNPSSNLVCDPIVNHLRETARCFYNSGLNVRAPDNFMLEQEAQLSSR